MKRVLFVALLASLISACGGGSGGSANAVEPVGDLTQEQIVEKFNLPPEPDVELNNATIEGIDSNNNDIRDDWERLIAFEHYNNPTMMNINNLSAKNTAAITKAYKAGNTDLYQILSDKEGELIGCAFYYNNQGFGSNILTKMSENTKDRALYFWKVGLETTKITGTGFHGMSAAQKSKICPKYAK